MTKQNPSWHFSFRFLKESFLAFLCGAMGTFGAFFLAATLIVSRGLSASVFSVLAIIGLCLGGFISSFVFACLHKSSALLCGVSTFLLFSTVLILYGLCEGCTALHPSALLGLFCLLISCATGGYVGVAKAEKQLKKRYKA